MCCFQSDVKNCSQKKVPQKIQARKINEGKTSRENYGEIICEPEVQREKIVNEEKSPRTSQMS